MTGTTMGRIRALAEAQARREIEECLVGYAQRAAAELRGDDDIIIVAKNELLTAEVLRRIPDINTFERLALADHRMQDSVFDAIDRYHSVLPHPGQDFKDWLERLVREEDGTVTSVTFNRKRGPRA